MDQNYDWRAAGNRSRGKGEGGILFYKHPGLTSGNTGNSSPVTNDCPTRNIFITGNYHVINVCVELYRLFDYQRITVLSPLSSHKTLSTNKCTSHLDLDSGRIDCSINVQFESIINGLSF